MEFLENYTIMINICHDKESHRNAPPGYSCENQREDFPRALMLHACGCNKQLELGALRRLLSADAGDWKGQEVAFYDAEYVRCVIVCHYI